MLLARIMHSGFLDRFCDNLTDVLFFSYSLCKSQLNSGSKFETWKYKNLNAILDSKSFKLPNFEKPGREIGKLNGTSHGLRSFPNQRVLGI